MYDRAVTGVHHCVTAGYSSLNLSGALHQCIRGGVKNAILQKAGTGYSYDSMRERLSGTSGFFSQYCVLLSYQILYCALISLIRQPGILRFYRHFSIFFCFSSPTLRAR